MDFRGVLKTEEPERLKDREIDRNWERKCAHSGIERVKKRRKRERSIREKVEVTEMVSHRGGEME